MTDWVIDLDGVMWRGRTPIPGSVQAVATLLDAGDRVVFCTNNSIESGEHRAARLVDQGVPPGCEVVTSADAVAALVHRGEHLLVVGGDGLRRALTEAGAHTVAASDGDAVLASGDFDAVVVGLTREFDYNQLDRAQAAVRAGARLLASNTDSSFPGPGGLHAGCGALVAAIETASGRPAVSAGKPMAPMVELIRRRLGSGAAATVVGDRGDTDGRMAEALGWPFGLVLSGVTHRDDLPLDVPVAAVADDLAGLVAQLAR